MTKKTVLITGAEGFIGNNATEYFLKNNCRVVALDLRKPIRRYLGHEKDCTAVHGDVRDTALLNQILQAYHVEYVIHFAAVSTIQMGSENAFETRDINVDGTRSVLEAVRRSNRVKGMIFPSTDKVYGPLAKEAYTEDDPLLPLNSPYDQSKAEADRLVRKWAAEYGVPAVVLRFCNIYGKYDLHDSRIIPHTIRAVLENRECLLKVYRDEDGHIRNYQRDFLYAGDLCGVLWHLTEEMERWNSGASDPYWGEAFNLGAQRCYSMDEIIWHIERLTGMTSRIKIDLSCTLPEIQKQRLDFSKAKEYLGFTPETSLTDGLRETIQWWRQYLEDEKNKEECK